MATSRTASTIIEEALRGTRTSKVRPSDFEPVAPTASRFPALADKHPETLPFSHIFADFLDASAIVSAIVAKDFNLPAPALDPKHRHQVPRHSDYLPDFKTLYRFALAYARRATTLVTGFPGTGKTNGLPVLLAHRLDLPLTVISLSDKHLHRDDLLGATQLTTCPTTGATVTAFEPGPLTRAIQHPGIVVLDEITRASAEIQNLLMRVMERDGELQVPHNTDTETGIPMPVVRRHPDCWVVATSNTKGLNDQADRLVGTEQVDGAILDRFTFTVEVDYLSANAQARLIEQWIPGFPSEVAVQLAQFATLVQGAYKRGELPLSLSPRGLRDIAELTCHFEATAPAVKATLLPKFAEEADVEAVAMMYHTVFNETL